MLSMKNLVATVLLAALVSGNPTPTANPVVPEGDIHAALMARATTSYYTVVSTAIPQDQFSIGMGQNGTDGDYCTITTVPSMGA